MSNPPQGSRYRILIGVGEPAHLAELLALAVPLARRRGGRVTPVYVNPSSDPPDWLIVPEDVGDVVDDPVILASTRSGQALLEYINEVEPALLLLHWRGEASRGQHLLGSTLDPLLQYAPCDVAVLRIKEPPERFAERMRSPSRILVPFGGGPNAGLAAELALDLSPDRKVTALRVASRNLGPTAASAEWDTLRALTADIPEASRLDLQVVQAHSVVQGITQAASEGHDLVLVGATGESFVDRMIFGNTPVALARTIDAPLLIVRRRGALPAEAWRRLRWRVINLMTQLSESERIRVYRQVRRAARADHDYIMMMMLATGIAGLGLLLNSTAVLIGAMLVAPLMSALLGLGMGIVQGDARLLRLAARTLAIGALIGVAIAGLIELLAPAYNPTAEMLARTSPTLLDLGVALISGAAAAYASAREDASAALPGVAIAVALVPPLTTFGLLAVSGQPALAGGALLLFLTNLVGIVAAASSVYLWMGFRPNTAEKDRARAFRGGVAATAVIGALVVAVLGILSVRALQVASLRRQVGLALDRHRALLGIDAELAEWDVTTQDGLTVSVSVETTDDVTAAEALNLQLALASELGQPTTLQVTVIPVRRIAPSALSESAVETADAGTAEGDAPSNQSP